MHLESSNVSDAGHVFVWAGRVLPLTPTGGTDELSCRDRAVATQWTAAGIGGFRLNRPEVHADLLTEVQVRQEP